MPQVQPKKRDATWDIARGIGMMLVIYGHFLEPMYPAKNGSPMIESAAAQWQVIYSFHMMLFFLVSGAVNVNLPKKAWPEALRGSLRLLALAWVVHIIGVIFAMIIGAAPDATRSVWDAVYAIGDPIVEGYLWSIGVLWFLTSLCFVQLLAYVTLGRIPALAVVLVAMVATAITPYLPNQYLLQTWFPGLSFFALGFLFTQWQIRWPVWAAIPFLAAAILLAPLNHGCSFSFSDTCGSIPFGVRMFAGSYGYLPLFFLSSLVGSLAVVCLSAGLARFAGPSAFLSYVGRNSLQLFIINGFVATFLFGVLWQVKWPHLTAFHYIGFAIGIIAAHLLVLRVLRPVLGWIDSAALAISDFIVRLITSVTGSAEAKAA